MNKIILKQITSGHYEVRYGEDNYIGDLIRDVDGYFYFHFDEDDLGSWAAYSLRMIADKLDEINKPWDDKLRQDPTINKEA